MLSYLLKMQETKNVKRVMVKGKKIYELEFKVDIHIATYFPGFSTYLIAKLINYLSASYTSDGCKDDGFLSLFCHCNRGGRPLYFHAEECFANNMFDDMFNYSIAESGSTTKAHAQFLSDFIKSLKSVARKIANDQIKTSLARKYKIFDENFKIFAEYMENKGLVKSTEDTDVVFRANYLNDEYIVLTFKYTRTKELNPDVIYLS